MVEIRDKEYNIILFYYQCATTKPQIITKHFVSKQITRKLHVE